MKKGFTLVELLIVMAVIAILIGIAVPSFRGMQMEANRTASQGNLQAIKLAFEAYYKNNGCYPTYTSPTGTEWQTEITGSNPPLLEVVPTDPVNGQSYQLMKSPNGMYYIVYSTGEDQTHSCGVMNDGVYGTMPSSGEVLFITNGHLASP